MNLTPFQNLQAQLRKTEVIPKGYRNANEIAEEEGTSAHQVRETMRKAVQKGLAERKEFVVNGRKMSYFKL